MKKWHLVDTDPGNAKKTVCGKKVKDTAKMLLRLWNLHLLLGGDVVTRNDLCSKCLRVWDKR